MRRFLEKLVGLFKNIRHGQEPPKATDTSIRKQLDELDKREAGLRKELSDIQSRRKKLEEDQIPIPTVDIKSGTKTAPVNVNVFQKPEIQPTPTLAGLEEIRKRQEAEVTRGLDNLEKNIEGFRKELDDVNKIVDKLTSILPEKTDDNTNTDELGKILEEAKGLAKEAKSKLIDIIVVESQVDVNIESCKNVPPAYSLTSSQKTKITSLFSEADELSGKLMNVSGRLFNIEARIQELNKELNALIAKQEEERRKAEEEIKKEQERQRKKEKEDEERRKKEKDSLLQKYLSDIREKEQREYAEKQRLISLSDNRKRDQVSISRLLRNEGISCFYHFTDRCNLKSIKSHGGLLSWDYCEKHNISIPAPGGGPLSRILDLRYGLQDYVRLSFCKDHPMKHIALKDGRIADPVTLEISTDVALIQDTLFSDMNATKNGHHSGPYLSDLEMVHFDTVRLPNHFDLNDAEKPYYQAEVMVKTFIPEKYILNLDEVLGRKHWFYF